MLMSLPEASVHHGKPANYFTIRRGRFRYHGDDEQRFPLPVDVVGRVERFDVQALIVWDERRLKRETQRRAELTRRKQLREADRLARRAMKEANR